MSTSHEPSYYEIALTNRQVLVAFVILLVCLVVAFLSGAWIGRDAIGSERAPVEMAASQKAAEEAQFGELNFFLEDARGGGSSEETKEPTAKRPSVAEIAEEASPETTLVDDLNGREAKRAESPSAAPQRAPDPVPPAPRPTVQEPAELQAAPLERGSADAVAAGGSFVIQVFSTADRVQAERVVGDLTKSGFDSFLSPVEVSNRTMFRVRVGPFPDRARADEVAAEVRRRHRLDTWVTQQ